MSLGSYKISCELRKTKLNHDFNFQQFKILTKISNVLSLELFLKKLIIVHDKDPFISLDLKYFDFVDENFIKFLRPTVEVKANLLTNGIISKISLPTFEFKYIKDNEFSKQEINILNPIIHKLAIEDITKWKDQIFQVIGEIDKSIESSIINSKHSEQNVTENDIFNKSSTTNQRKKTNISKDGVTLVK